MTPSVLAKRFAFGAATILAGAFAAVPVMAQDKVKIGMMLTLSGPAANIGTEMRRTTEMALAHLGGKMGGKEVEVVYEDDQIRPEIGKQKTDKLVEQDKVAFIGGYVWSNVILSSYKSAADAGVFVLSSVGGPSQIAGADCHPNFFGASHENDQNPEAMGALMQARGVKKLYLMAPNYAAGKDIMAAVKHTFKGEIVGEDYTKWPGQLDFSAELSKVRSSPADALFIFYPGPSGVQFLQQFDQAGLKGKVPLYQVFTVDALAMGQLKDLAIGPIGVQHWVNDLPNETNKKMVSEYLAKYNDYPSLYGAMAYDTIRMIGAAVDAVKGDLTKKDEIRAALASGKFPTVRGEVKFGNNHFPIQNFYQQETVKDAQGRLTLKTVSTVLTAYQDRQAPKCSMK